MKELEHCPPNCPWNPGKTSALIGKGHIWGGLWSKIEIIQVLGLYRCDSSSEIGPKEFMQKAQNRNQRRVTGIPGCSSPKARRGANPPPSVFTTTISPPSITSRRFDHHGPCCRHFGGPRPCPCGSFAAPTHTLPVARSTGLRRIGSVPSGTHRSAGKMGAWTGGRVHFSRCRVSFEKSKHALCNCMMMRLKCLVSFVVARFNSASKPENSHYFVSLERHSTRPCAPHVLQRSQTLYVVRGGGRQGMTALEQIDGSMISSS